MLFKYSHVNIGVIAIFRICLFFKILKNKNHFAGVMRVTNPKSPGGLDIFPLI